MIKMTLKEIGESNRYMVKEICKDFWDISVDIITNVVKEMMTDMWFESMRDAMRCLNWFGKMILWATLGVFTFILCFMLACVFFMLGVFILCVLAMFVIVWGVLYLPSIPYRWVYQRTLRPFFRFLFRKKTLECYND